jgi:hypothetical protein
VVISSLDGLGGRPFTVPGTLLEAFTWAIPGIGPLLAIASAIRGLRNKYVLFLGTDGYNDAINYRVTTDGAGHATMAPGQNLIHELTHVWQGYNNAFSWSYVLNSVSNQFTQGESAAYGYVLGQQWDTYDAEPQARIVEHWYNISRIGALWHESARKGTLISNSDTYKAYMDCNIRPGLPHARTVFGRTIRTGRAPRWHCEPFSPVD